MREDLAFAIGQLRHLYFQMVEGHVKDCEKAAKGLLAPAIEILEYVQNDLADDDNT